MEQQQGQLKTFKYILIIILYYVLYNKYIVTDI